MLQRTSVTLCTLLVTGIKITFNKDEALGCCSLLIPATDLKMVRVHYGPCGPVLFIQTLVGVAAQLRDILPFQDHCFDPEHKDDACRYITIIPDKNQVTDEKAVTAMFDRMQAGCPANRRFAIQTIGGDVASQLLKAKPSSLSSRPAGNTPTQTVFYITANGQVIRRQVMPGELVAKPTEGDEDEEMADRSRSPSPPRPTFIGPIIKLFTYPPPPVTGGITVTNEDFFCLKDGEFLNDVIIDFYLKYLQREVLSKEDRDRSHVFSSFFYRRLVQKQPNELKDSTMTLQQLRHWRVKKWTKHVDLFSKDFIIVPINESAHWYLAIICFPGLVGISATKQKIDSSEVGSSDAGDGGSVAEQGAQSEKADSTQNDNNGNDSFIKKPCVLIFDSLAMPTRYGVVHTLREYLQCEWDAKKKAKEGCRSYTKDSMQGACPRCPRQTNLSDCGVYVLQYVECFFNDPIRNFTLPISTLVNWFTEEVIVSKRESLRQLVLRLQKGLNPKLDFDPCQNSVDTLTTGPTIQLLSPAPGTPTVDSTSQANSEGTAEAISSADSTKEWKLAEPDGTQQDGGIAEKVDSSADPSPKTEVNDTQDGNVSKNGSVSTGSLDAVDSVSNNPSMTTAQEEEEEDTNRAGNCEAKREIAGDDETLDRATINSQEYNLPHASTRFDGPQTSSGENVSTTGQFPVLSTDAVFRSSSDANSCTFSDATEKDACDALTKECGNFDNLNLHDIRSLPSNPTDDAGGDEMETVACNNGQLHSDSISMTGSVLSSFELNSAEEIGKSVEASTCDSSKLCSRDADYSFGKETFDSDYPANHMSTAAENQPS